MQDRDHFLVLLLHAHNVLMKERGLLSPFFLEGVESTLPEKKKAFVTDCNVV